MANRLHILQGGVKNGDFAFIVKTAGTTKKFEWSSTRLAQAGDNVLMYVIRPYSALIARAVVTTAAWESDDWPYRCRLGQLQLLPGPKTIRELKIRYRGWRWLIQPRRNTTVPDEYADLLWKWLDHPSQPREDDTSTGAGFGCYEDNVIVEKMAVEKVTHDLEKQGYRVKSRELDGVGYDLDASNGKVELHVEVKGVSGPELCFTITDKEVRTAGKDSAFRLYVVTQALTPGAKLHVFKGNQLKQQFTLSPISYRAKQSDGIC